MIFARQRFVIMLAAFTLVSCGKEAPPSGPSVAASPEPTPTPTPTPEPTPTPTPSPMALSCNLPEQDDCGASCCEEGGEALFDDEIEAAQATLRTASPELFNDNGSLTVDEETYTAALARQLTAQFGLCARGGGRPSSISRDEVAIKRDNEVSQNVDVILGASNSPHVGGRYTCRPAAF
jgi:hypothetical protein